MEHLMLTKFKLFLIIGLFGVFIFWLGCSEDDEDDLPKKDDSVLIAVVVSNDDVFDFDKNDKIAEVLFTDSRGPIGTPVSIEIEHKEIERFDGREITATLLLENPELTKVDEFEITHLYSDKKTNMKFLAPQVIAIPSLLNFQLILTVQEPDSENNFEAIGYYQFLVKRGAPAT